MRIVLTLIALSALAFAGDTKLGKPLTLKEPMAVADVTAQAEKLAGTTVQVKGKVTEVCQMMGCWMQLVDPKTNAGIRIKVKDGEITFPKTAVGKIAVAEGKLSKTELTKDQATERLKHEAEENKRKFDPSTVKGPMTFWQIDGTGAVILE